MLQIQMGMKSPSMESKTWRFYKPLLCGLFANLNIKNISRKKVTCWTAAQKPYNNLVGSNTWSLSSPTSHSKHIQFWCYIRLLRNLSRQVLKISIDKHSPDSSGTCSTAKQLSRWRSFSLYLIRFPLLQRVFIAFGVWFFSVCFQDQSSVKPPIR